MEIGRWKLGHRARHMGVNIFLFHFYLVAVSVYFTIYLGLYFVLYDFFSFSFWYCLFRYSLCHSLGWGCVDRFCFFLLFCFAVFVLSLSVCLVCYLFIFLSASLLV